MWSIIFTVCLLNQCQIYQIMPDYTNESACIISGFLEKQKLLKFSEKTLIELAQKNKWSIKEFKEISSTLKLSFYCRQKLLK